jgi:hypothetical protein
MLARPAGSLHRRRSRRAVPPRRPPSSPVEGRAPALVLVNSTTCGRTTWVRTAIRVDHAATTSWRGGRPLSQVRRRVRDASSVGRSHLALATKARRGDQELASLAIPLPAEAAEYCDNRLSANFAPSERAGSRASTLPRDLAAGGSGVRERFRCRRPTAARCRCAQRQRAQPVVTMVARRGAPSSGVPGCPRPGCLTQRVKASERAGARAWPPDEGPTGRRALACSHAERRASWTLRFRSQPRRIVRRLARFASADFAGTAWCWASDHEKLGSTALVPGVYAVWGTALRPSCSSMLILWRRTVDERPVSLLDTPTSWDWSDAAGTQSGCHCSRPKSACWSWAARSPSSERCAPRAPPGALRWPWGTPSRSGKGACRLTGTRSESRARRDGVLARLVPCGQDAGWPSAGARPRIRHGGGRRLRALGP